MILWVDGAHAPIENMRRDACLLAAVERGAEPVLRLFRFAPFGITLGRSQDPERELDLERCRADHVPWAVRPTGGRAIFHAQEWTYALAAPIADPRWGGARGEAYARGCALVVASLERLGVPAALVPAGRRIAAAEAGGHAGVLAGAPSAPCFATTARHEIVLGRGKLVGCAQRRTRRGLLQQGSVLLGDGHIRLADYLRLPARKRDQVRAALALSTRHAGRWLPGDAPLGLWADALAEEMGGGARRLEGEAGAFLLTLGEAGSYTASLFAS